MTTMCPTNVWMIATIITDTDPVSLLSGTVGRATVRGAAVLAAHWLAILGWAATVVGVASSVPQAWRHLRTRSDDGTPLSTLTPQIVGAVWWITYETGNRAWPAAAGSLFWLVCVMVSISAIWPSTSNRTRLGNAALAVAGIAVTVPMARASLDLVGVVAGVLGTARLIPAVTHMWRRRHGGLPAVAPAGWVLGLGQAAMWSFYAAGSGLAVLLVSSIVYAVASAGVILLVRHARMLAPAERITASQYPSVREQLAETLVTV